MLITASVIVVNVAKTEHCKSPRATPSMEIQLNTSYLI